MENMSFEQALKRIDEIVKHLERGDAALEQSLALFEEGTALIRSCGKMLDEAEQKVSLLTAGEDGSPVRQPFGEEV